MLTRGNTSRGEYRGFVFSFDHTFFYNAISFSQSKTHCFLWFLLFIFAKTHFMPYHEKKKHQLNFMKLWGIDSRRKMELLIKIVDESLKRDLMYTFGVNAFYLFYPWFSLRPKTDKSCILQSRNNDDQAQVWVENLVSFTLS